LNSFSSDGSTAFCFTALSFSTFPALLRRQYFYHYITGSAGTETSFFHHAKTAADGAAGFDSASPKNRASKSLPGLYV
jgi:hypothetical protein